MIKKLLIFLVIGCTLSKGDWLSFDGTPVPTPPTITILQNDTSKVILNVKTHGIVSKDTTVDDIEYQRIWMPREITTADIGKAEIPILKRLIQIQPSSGTVIATTTIAETLYSDFNVFPLQILATDSGPEPPFVKDTVFYNSDIWYPAETTTKSGASILKDLRVISLGIQPLSFNPVQQKILVKNELNIEIDFEGTDPENTIPGPPVVKARSLDLLYDHSVLNYEPQVDSTIPLGGQSVMQTKYLFLTADELCDALDSLVFWKLKKGCKVIVKKLSEVPGYTGDPGDTVDIKNYLQTEISGNYFWIIVLVGDEQAIPQFNEWIHSGHQGPNYSDRYYACLIGSDELEDVVLGRLCVTTTSQIDGITEKIFAYERTPSSAWFKNRVYLVAAYHGIPAPWDSMFARDKWHVRDNYLIPNSTPYQESYIENANCLSVSTWINDGVGLVNYRGHGLKDRWMHGDEVYIWRVYDLHNRLHNVAKYPIVLNVCCNCGAIHEPTETLVEAWVNTLDKGAVGALGATRPSHRGFNRMMDIDIFDFLYSAPACYAQYYTIGGAIWDARNKLTQTGTQEAIDNARTYLYAGDPGLPIWRENWGSLQVSHPSMIHMGESTILVAVQDAYGNRIEHAQVCLYKPGEVHDWSETGINGGTLRTITTRSRGKLYVTVTFSNSCAYEGECVINPFIATPLVEPFVTQADKSETDITLTWNKVTTDTLGTPKTPDYYLIYRDTVPAFVPIDSLNLISIVFHPETTHTDSGVISDALSYYYLVKAVDSTGIKSKKSNMAYVFHKFVNENPGTTDKNWVSLPWYNNYSTISDLTGDLSPSGNPLTKITNLRNDQSYESWIWDDLFMEWCGTDFSITSGRGYEMVACSDDTILLAGSNSPDGLISLHKEPASTGKNWIMIPYNALYNTVSDITDEYSSQGEAVEKITNLRDDQFFESWIWDSAFMEWCGNNFAIELGRSYEMVAVTDTTWNPTEYSNEAEEPFLATSGHTTTKARVILGSSVHSGREPAWIVDSQSSDRALAAALTTNGRYECAYLYKLNSTDERSVGHRIKSSHLASESGEEYGERGGPGAGPDDRKISHTVRSYLANARGFENIVFTTYRVELPEDVLTEKMVGSATYANQQVGVIWFDVGNFRIPWKHGQEAVLIVEATKNAQPYYDVIDYVLDEKVDIQKLQDIKLKLVPEPGSPALSSAASLRSITENDNIIGYSLYENDTRLNTSVLQDARSVSGNISVRLVIKGGHETVYSSDGTQSRPDHEAPITFAFNIAPNPFAKHARMDYALPKLTLVNMIIYDICGRHVRTLVSEVEQPGHYSIIWDGFDDYGSAVPAGVYFVRMKADGYETREKILLIK